MRLRGMGLAVVMIPASFGFVSGCKHESNAGPAAVEKPRNDARELIDRLDKAAFYRYCETPESAKQAKIAALEGGPFGKELTRRTCPMDTEKLANGGTEEFMGSCKAIFEVHGVKLAKTAQMIVVGIGYLVQVNDFEYQVYTVEDTYSDHLWDIAAKGTLTMCNAVLQRAGSDEKMYMLHSGHDAVAVFLTDEQFNILKDSSLSESEKPKPADAIIVKP